MPSFFRSAEDVRIFFLNETDTAEKKRKYARLKTIFSQCVRRPGTRGHFFFHRKSSSLGGAPILIFEPQGPVDRGIFQEGITRFGETLFGTFRCTAPGFIELEIKRNIAPANAIKYGRDIRDVIKGIAGIMQTGGDDRVKIITPKDKARIAREAADLKRKEADEARERRRLQNEERRLRREARQKSKADKKAASTERERPRRAERAERVERAEREQSPRQLRRQKEEAAAIARIERLQKEAEAAETEGQSVEATAAAEDARDLAGELEQHLRAARAPARAVARACKGKNKVQIQAALFQLVAAGTHREAASRLLARVRSAGATPVEKVVADWRKDEEGRFAELVEAVDESKSEALALEKLASRTQASAMSAREEAATLKVEEIQARLAAAEATAAAGGEASLEALRQAAAAAEAARKEIEVAARQQDAARSLRAIQAGLARLEASTPEDQLLDPRKLRRLMRQDTSMSKGLKRLRRAITGLRAVGAPSGAMSEVWADYPDLLWAQATILSAI